MKRLMVLFAGLLAILMSISAASAITVDGQNSSGEWNHNWAFDQNNNATAAAEYNIYNTGDRLEVRQGAFGDGTSTWNAEDPKNDSGSDHDTTMATRGDSSGFDLKRIYGHYDPATDTLYGMATVYGIPGDLDADGDISENCLDGGDCIGDAGPAGSGIGESEQWRIRISQPGKDDLEVRVTNNDWSISQGPGTFGYNDVEARFNSNADGVYEIAIHNVTSDNLLNVGPCASDIMIQVQGGGIIDNPGEDTATAFIYPTCPDIDITKYVSKDNSTWLDANNPGSGPTYINESGEPVYWKYVVTNTGDEPLTDVNVTDDKLGFIADIGNLGHESGNNTAVVYAEGTVPDPCENYRNVGTTNGVGVVSGVPVTDNDPAHYNCGEKPPNGVPALTPTSLMGLIGALGLIGIIGLKRRD